MHFLLICACLLISNLGSSQSRVQVANYEELLTAIQNPEVRAIKITEKWLFISEEMGIDSTGFSPRALGLNIMNRSNLKIEGAKGGTYLVTRDRDAVTLLLYQVNNIQFKGLIIGHAPERGSYCSAGVVELEESNDIKFEDCTFFGCGTYGLNILNSNNIEMTNCSIRSCSNGIAFFGNVNQVYFRDCLFTDNNYAYYAFSFSNSNKIVFENCEINLTRMEDNQQGTLFLVAENQRMPVIFRKCAIEGNSAHYWKRDKQAVLKFEDCTLQYNFFQEKNTQ